MDCGEDHSPGRGSKWQVARSRLNCQNKTDDAGASVEQELGSWKASNGIHCRHMPDDEQGILRLSIGGGDHLPSKMNYVVVRGKIGQCIELLEKALVALRECPE